MTPRNPRPDRPDSPSEQPAYGLAEAARYLKLPVATLRSWVVGRSYPTTGGGGRFHPLIHPPAPEASHALILEPDRGARVACAPD
jgi:hypothetical protein